MNTEKILWVSWHQHRRTESITQKIDAELIVFDLSRYRVRIIRYFIGAIRTWCLFNTKKPTSVIVQNPSFFLAFIAVLWKPLFHYRIGVDTHNSGFGVYRKNPFLHLILRYIDNNADYIIAHNRHIRDALHHDDDKYIVIPDPVPDLPQAEKIHLKATHNILYICTFSNDEPYQNVIEVAHQLPVDCHLYITGRYEENIKTGHISESTTLLGWISQEKYCEYIFSADIIMTLTTRDNCLLCGAYEAVGASRPLIISDTVAIRDYFIQGVVYTGHTPMELRAAIEQALTDKKRLTDEIGQLKRTFQENWAKHRKTLLHAAYYQKEATNN